MKMTKRTGKTIVLRQRLDGLVVAISVHPHRQAAEAQIETETNPIVTKMGEEKPEGPFPLRWIIIPAATVYESDHTWPPKDQDPSPSKIITPGPKPGQGIITP
tara:strand:+ start:88 stop:396 length:309 start_codon:yes stop_codon:yes gene_type:complete